METILLDIQLKKMKRSKNKNYIEEREGSGKIYVPFPENYHKLTSLTLRHSTTRDLLV